MKRSLQDNEKWELERTHPSVKQQNTSSLVESNATPQTESTEGGDCSIREVDQSLQVPALAFTSANFVSKAVATSSSLLLTPISSGAKLFCKANAATLNKTATASVSTVTAAAKLQAASEIVATKTVTSAIPCTKTVFASTSLICSPSSTTLSKSFAINKTSTLISSSLPILSTRNKILHIIAKTESIPSCTVSNVVSEISASSLATISFTTASIPALPVSTAATISSLTVPVSSSSDPIAIKAPLFAGIKPTVNTSSPSSLSADSLVLPTATPSTSISIPTSSTLSSQSAIKSSAISTVPLCVASSSLSVPSVESLVKTASSLSTSGSVVASLSINSNLAPVSASLCPLHLLALSSESSSDSSNDSVGVVPVTYSASGEGSVTSLSFTMHTINSSMPSGLSSDNPNFNIQLNHSSATSLFTDSLRHNTLTVDRFAETSNSVPHIASLSSLPTAASHASNLRPPNLSNGHLALGSLRPQNQQVELEAFEERLISDHNLTENLLEDPSLSLLTSAPLTTAQDEVEAQALLSRDEERKLKEKYLLQSGKVPVAGVSVPKGQLRRAGPYLLGPRLGSSPVRSIVQCLARKDNTDKFYTLKILTVREACDETQDDRQGKMLLHTEHALLSLLSGQCGVIQHHGLFQDYACGAREQTSGAIVATGGLVRRVCLVLDCVTPHDYCPHTADLINLQHYVITKKKLAERDALTIFYNIVTVVHSLHEQNIVHRDLKLGNLVLHRTTREITITNFCLGQHLPSEKDRLRDQRGSPAYISPDVLSGKPYLGKPSDMWALGVVLFTMLYGHFPFYDASPQELFRKIKAAQYTLPKGDKPVKESTKDVIRGLLVLDPLQRFTCKQVLSRLGAIISSPVTKNPQLFQVVPEMEDVEDQTMGTTASINELETNVGSFNCDNLDHCFKNNINISSRSKKSRDRDVDSQAKHNLDYLLLQVARQNEECAHMGSHKSAVSSNSSTLINNSSSSNTSNGMISCIVGDARSLTQAELSSLRHILPHTSRLKEPVTQSSGPPQNVAVVVSRSSSDRFSSLFSPQSSGSRNYPINLLRSPAANHPPAPPNETVSPAPLPPHVLSSHIPSLPSHHPPTSRIPPSSSRSLPSNSVIPTFGVFSNSVPSQNSLQRGSHPPAPPTGSRTRWTPGVHNHILQNISNLQHLASSSNGQEETLPISPQGVGDDDQSDSLSNPVPGISSSSSSSHLSRGPFRLLVRAARGRAGPLLSRRPYRQVRRYR
ncbi:uncharacterized protein [Procambarus clarkii]|uniref:uncharacterized protein n=1 Tax=Procambarus clarkii TaxID=6728 RepID=UPI0037438D91